MRVSRRFAAAAASTTLLLASVSAQTYSTCNPLQGAVCPPDPALAGSATVDFTSGASSDFTAQGDTVSYDSTGAAFTISQSGDSPQIVSNWYIMFGRVEIVMQAAPGVGIVSSAVLQSDDLDEIDWEWLGADPTSVQTNYFGKGITGAYDRGTTVPISNSQTALNTYTLDWTAEQTVWSINGSPVRTLTPATAEVNQYPQTPMQIKIGSWSAGDSSNAPGVIAWAGGPTDYGAGPYTMYVQSVSVTDYSTGKSYSYSGTTGSWQDIVSNGGSISSTGSGHAPAAAPEVISAAPQPEGSSRYSPPAYTTLITTPSATVTTYPGLPSGWTVASSGMVIPPSSAPTYHKPLVTSSSPALPQHSANSGHHEKAPVKPAPTTHHEKAPVKPAPTTSYHVYLPATTAASEHKASARPTDLYTYKGDASGRHITSAGIAGCAILCAALLL